jgi:hypothetical protein
MTHVSFRSLLPVLLLVGLMGGMPAAEVSTDDPAIKLLIHAIPQATGASARAEVTGGVAPYQYRWSMDWYDRPAVGSNAPELAAFPIKPWLRALVCCVVTDARGRTARAFRHILPLPPGERSKPIRFFGIGDSIENAGEAWDAPHPAVIAIAAHLCEQAMGLPTGGIPWDRTSYPGYKSEEIAANLPKILERMTAFGATDVFIRMGLNVSANTAATSAATILQLARAVKQGCPSVERVWVEPCTSRAESDDRLWKMAEACKAFTEDWLTFTSEAGHWHQRRAPDLYGDETHPGPDANRALGLTRAAAWIVKGPPSHPDGVLPPR